MGKSRRTVRAHVLFCFLAYYLVKQMDLELHSVGEHREVELLLRRWDQLKVGEVCVELGEERRTEWQWTLDEVGQSVQQELQGVGWWHSVDGYRRSLIRMLAASGQRRAAQRFPKLGRESWRGKLS
ncbi:MAG TPA: hypothetical protein VLK32_06510 [Bacillota bacterium]|nr:hypothetical protein [Bacillota bacterium]